LAKKFKGDFKQMTGIMTNIPFKLLLQERWKSEGSSELVTMILEDKIFDVLVALKQAMTAKKVGKL
jgi:hypothetical protein